MECQAQSHLFVNQVTSEDLKTSLKETTNVRQAQAERKTDRVQFSEVWDRLKGMAGMAQGIFEEHG